MESFLVQNYEVIKEVLLSAFEQNNETWGTGVPTLIRWYFELLVRTRWYTHATKPVKSTACPRGSVLNSAWRDSPLKSEWPACVAD